MGTLYREVADLLKSSTLDFILAFGGDLLPPPSFSPSYRPRSLSHKFSYMHFRARSAAIPEGLPVVIMVMLALDVVCSNKTGDIPRIFPSSH